MKLWINPHLEFGLHADAATIPIQVTVKTPSPIKKRLKFLY